MTLTLDASVAQRLDCPLCRHPLTDLGFLYSGNRFVPRPVAALKHFKIDGTIEGLLFGCSECGTVLVVRTPGPLD